ncbi:MAG TPA: nucleotidyltransferase family protein [Myxococcota bacterium]|nr:nucleotidyltransferase family protein [Myxococcota bacterium]HQK51498.1 nucleotidyltransferase family protein [Myxococcota bacterium]
MDLPFPRHPPQSAAPPGFLWALQTAFAPPEVPPVPPPVPWAQAEPILRPTGLLPMVAARLAHPDLRHRLDPEWEAKARQAREAQADSALRALATAAQVARIALQNAIPVVFLKGAALHLADQVPVCGRPLADVDVLVPAATADRLQSRLIAAGFRRIGPSLSRHHLDPLGPPPGGLPVEIHRHLPGCRAPEAPGRPLRFEDLLPAGRTTTVSVQGLKVPVPAPEVLAAHGVVHGLLDHGLRPDRYPPWRWVLDLAAIQEAPPSSRWLAWVADPAVSRWGRTVEALLVHLRDLPSGASLLPAAPGTRHLFLHLTASALDPRYRLALQARQWWPWPLRTDLREGIRKAFHRLRHPDPTPDEIPSTTLADRLWASLEAFWEFYLTSGGPADRRR